MKTLDEDITTHNLEPRYDMDNLVTSASDSGGDDESLLGELKSESKDYTDSVGANNRAEGASWGPFGAIEKIEWQEGKTPEVIGDRLKVRKVEEIQEAMEEEEEREKLRMESLEEEARQAAEATEEREKAVSFEGCCY
jgi:hypothetical protein